MQTDLFQRKNSFSTHLGFILAVGLLAIFGLVFSFLFASQPSQTLRRTSYFHASSAPQILNTPTITSTQSNPSTNWNQYRDAAYSLQYPSNWVVDGNYDAYYKGQVVTIKSPTQNVQVKIYPKQPTYGFGASQGYETHNLKVVMDGQEYIAMENISEHRAFVDLKIGTSEYHVLFGTGYPVSDDRFASISEYTANRDTILKILATLKITVN